MYLWCRKEMNTGLKLLAVLNRKTEARKKKIEAAKRVQPKILF